MKGFEREKRMKENIASYSGFNRRWGRVVEKTCTASKAQPRSSERGRPAVCVRMSVCGCFRVRADQQLGVGVSAWMTDHFLLTLPLHLDTKQNKGEHTFAHSGWGFWEPADSTSYHLFRSGRKAEGSGTEIQNLLLILQTGLCQEWHNCFWIFLPPPNHNDSFNLNLRKYILQACTFWMHLKEWKVRANMTSAENKAYSGGWGWKGIVNVVHVRVCVTAKMCVGVPVRMFACDWAL